MFFIMVREKGIVRPYGLRWSKSAVVISVTRANQVEITMIRLTQIIWTVLRGESWARPLVPTPKIITITATKLAVSWNCRDLATES